MSVNSYLEKLASSLIIGSNEKGDIKTSIDAITQRLKAFFGLQIEDIVLFGSYERGTILPRKADENSDIDLMVVFDDTSEYKPQTFLNKLKDFAEYYYPKSIVHQDRPSVVLELRHIKFDLVPAYKRWGEYRIPLDSSRWLVTEPKSFSSNLTAVNKRNRFKVKPVIRLVKHWNIQKNYRGVASFDLETKICNGLEYSYFICDSYTDYLDKALDSIRFLANGNRVASAQSKIKEAMRLEREGYPNSALAKIQEVFPAV